MLVKITHRNLSMIKLNEKHLQRGEQFTAYSTIDEINLLAVNFLDLKLKYFTSTCSITLNRSPL